MYPDMERCLLYRCRKAQVQGETVICEKDRVKVTHSGQLS